MNIFGIEIDFDSMKGQPGPRIPSGTPVYDRYGKKIRMMNKYDAEDEVDWNRAFRYKDGIKFFRGWGSD